MVWQQVARDTSDSERSGSQLALEGETVCVCPGTYPEALSFDDTTPAFRLLGVAGPDHTVIDGTSNRCDCRLDIGVVRLPARHVQSQVLPSLPASSGATDQSLPPSGSAPSVPTISSTYSGRETCSSRALARLRRPARSSCGRASTSG